MKINWNDKYNTIAAYSFIVAVSVIMFYLAISQVSIFTDKLDSLLVLMNPFIIGFAIAYVINFLVKFYEKNFLKLEFIRNLNKKAQKALIILLSYITTFLIISIIIKFLLPEVLKSIIGLVNDIPFYITNTNKLINETISSLSIEKQYLQIIIENFNNVIDHATRFITNLIPALAGFIGRTISSIWNVILGFIISIYLLKDKENLCALSKKITFGIFKETTANEIVSLVSRSNHTFGKFLIGKIIDSIIIGILTFLVLAIFKMPYTVLISVTVGITNIIPFFGPFIGAIPSFIIILFVSPIKALWFLIIILVIQQIDGNIIGPKILGDSVGVSAFWILFSILVFGKLMGVLGMVIGVPLFAISYSIVKGIIENRLRKKGLKVETKDYI
ncbi:AI-2E family transporter [Clostridium malenominatum]|uniref:AI-2E family transporter n=1 Tax=Clostridium malenominatum TaxID=1539 RepID=A0ABP3UHV3_9CLOT